jgi:MFS family permease
MKTLGAISEFLALRRNTSLLLGALVLAGTGEKLWLGFAPKYLQTLGGSIFVIGLFDALQTLLGALYAYPGGWLTDRWGQRRSLMLFSMLSLAGYALVLVWHHWLALVLGAFLFLAWSAFSLPTTFTVVATSLQARQHTMGIGVQSMVRRVPMMLGPLAGGWLITRFGWTQGVRYALLICLALSVMTMAFQWFMVEPQGGEEDPATQKGVPKTVTPRPRKRAAGTNENEDDDADEDETQGQTSGFLGVVESFTPALRELLVSDILIRFCERIPYAWVILWAMNHGGLNAQQFGVLVAFEMVTAMVCYIPVAHLADKYGRRPFVLATFGFFTLFPVTLLWARSFGWLALAFVVRGLKEFGEPARKALIIGEAAPELRARTYGAYYLIRDCVVTSGSFLGAWLWSLGPRVNFAGAAACGMLGTVWFWRFVYRRGAGARRSR